MKPGDVVRLKSGGPPMTVTKISVLPNDDRELAACSWFNEKDNRRDLWPTDALVLVDETSKQDLSAEGHQKIARLFPGMTVEIPDDGIYRVEESKTK